MLSYISYFLKSLNRDEEGQALTEYGLIIALVAIVLIAGLGVLTGALDGVFDSIGDALNGTEGEGGS